MSKSSISNLELANLRKRNIIINFVFLINTIITSIAVTTVLGVAHGLPVAVPFIVGTIFIAILNLTKKYPNVIPIIAILSITISALIPNQPPTAYLLFNVYILVCGAFYLDKKLFILSTIGFIITLLNAFVFHKAQVVLGIGLAAPLTFFAYTYALLLAQQLTAYTFMEKVDECNSLNEEKLNIYRRMTRTNEASSEKN